MIYKVKFEDIKGTIRSHK